MANSNLTFLASLFLTLIFFSCESKSFDSKDELVVHLQDVDNGYHFKKSINGIDFSLTYRPTDLMVSQFMDTKAPQVAVDQLRRKYADYLYFNLSMSANGKELLSQKVQNRAEFGARVNQFSFGMADKVTLTNQKRDTLPLLDYVYPRMYGLGASTEMLLVYKKDQQTKQQDYLFLTIQDLGYGTGEVSFKIDTKKIENQPTLKF